MYSFGASIFAPLPNLVILFSKKNATPVSKTNFFLSNLNLLIVYKSIYYEVNKDFCNPKQLFQKELNTYDRAKKDLKSSPTCGIKIPKNLWPRDYIKKYGITNLWKYDLPNGWRLVYTIQTNEIMILNVILEWFDHKEYEKR